MTEETLFTFEVDTSLRDAFLAEASAIDKEGSQLMRELMRDFVESRRTARDHDAWFRAEVEKGLREADDPNTVLTPHEEVMAEMKARLEERLARAAKRAG